MSVLLRHPASVPTLFARSVDLPPLPAPHAAWMRFVRSAPVAFTTTLCTVVLIEVPLVRAAAAAVGLALTP